MYDVPVQTSTSLVQGSKGQLIDMMVKTIFDLPMAYCRLQMPNGQVHGVSERFNMSGGLQFYGKGLQYGECGIQIVNVNDNDFGVWKATFQVEEKEYSIEMVLTKQGKIVLGHFRPVIPGLHTEELIVFEILKLHRRLFDSLCGWTNPSCYSHCRYRTWILCL